MQNVHTVPKPVEHDYEPEAAWIAAAQRDPDAFARLYDRYVERVYRYAFRRLSVHTDAEDVTAQTFHRALEGLPRYSWTGAPFGAWLFRIAHNLIVDRYRAGAGPISLDGLAGGGGTEATDPEAVSLDDRLTGREAVDTAWAAVATLPALQRRAVTLRFGRDLSHAEVGTVIGRSEPATKQLIYRAMKTLRVQLGAER